MRIWHRDGPARFGSVRFGCISNMGLGLDNRYFPFEIATEITDRRVRPAQDWVIYWVVWANLDLPRPSSSSNRSACDEVVRSNSTIRRMRTKRPWLTPFAETAVAKAVPPGGVMGEFKSSRLSPGLEALLIKPSFRYMRATNNSTSRSVSADR